MEKPWLLWFLRESNFPNDSSPWNRNKMILMSNPCVDVLSDHSISVILNGSKYWKELHLLHQSADTVGSTGTLGWYQLQICQESRNVPVIISQTVLWFLLWACNLLMLVVSVYMICHDIQFTQNCVRCQRMSLWHVKKLLMHSHFWCWNYHTFLVVVADIHVLFEHCMNDSEVLLQ